MIRASVAAFLDCYPKVFFACHRAHVRDEHSKRFLSSRQASVLDHLDAVDPMHLDELAAHLGVGASSMCLMIDRLERDGYVRRARASHDQRRINLRLTKAGVRIKEQQKILAPDLVEELLQRLSASDREAALAGLRLLAAAADDLVAARLSQKSRKHPA